MLYTAWEIDKYKDYKKVRKDIAAVKATMPTVLHDIAWRAMQVHGALGVTNEMPLFKMIHGAAAMGLVDGPTEVHKTTVASRCCATTTRDDLWPSEWIPPQTRGRTSQIRPVPRTGSRQPVTPVH